MPDFAVETVYDLAVPSLQAQGSRLLDEYPRNLEQPSRWTPEMKQWPHNLPRTRTFALSACQITQKNGFNVQLRNLGLIRLLGSEALHI